MADPAPPAAEPIPPPAAPAESPSPPADASPPRAAPSPAAPPAPNTAVAPDASQAAAPPAQPADSAPAAAAPPDAAEQPAAPASESATAHAPAPEPAAPAAEPATPVTPENLYAQAVWNYAALEDNEISFAQGEYVLVLLRANADWWEGINLSVPDSKPGYFPANRVKLLPGPPPGVALPAPASEPPAAQTEAAADKSEKPAEPAPTAGPPEVPGDATKPEPAASPEAEARVAEAQVAAHPAAAETIPAAVSEAPVAAEQPAPAAEVPAGEVVEAEKLPAETEVTLGPEPSGAEPPEGASAEGEAHGEAEQAPAEGQVDAEPIQGEGEQADATAAPQEVTDPEELLDTDGNPLPPDWRKVWRDEDQAFYYFNVVTEETSWDIPGKVAAADGVPETTDSQESLESITATLPPNWEAVRDDSGNLYYYNSATEQTSWDVPPADGSETTPVSGTDSAGPSPMASQASMDYSAATGPPLPPRSHPPAQFLTFEAIPPNLVLAAGPVLVRLQGGEDRRLSKDWIPFWGAAIRGALVLFTVAPQGQKFFYSWVDLSQAQWRQATKDDTKKRNALFFENPGRAGYVLRTEDDAEFARFYQAFPLACTPFGPAELELVAKVKELAAFLEMQGDHAGVKKEKSAWKSMGGLFAQLGGKSSGDIPPPAVRKPLPETPPAPQVFIPPYACFGGRIPDQVAKQQRKIPYIVETCIGEVDGRGLQSEGIYRVSGNAANVQRLKVLFNSQDCPALPVEDSPIDINSIASLLKAYFRELANPLIPFETYEDFLNAVRLPSRDMKLSQIKDLVQSMAAGFQAHYNVLEYLMRHLQRVQAQSDVNKMEPSNLAIVFGPTILKSPAENAGNVEIMNIPLQNELVELMVETCDWLFDVSDCTRTATMHC
ncbi:hypothetical protein DFJ74DRAFT_708221 [Hyaloraphidium curvatum]|nr:hypothetical protein DFJ74DRAFT_708221 [Hyaloraphidium curvatum]